MIKKFEEFINEGIIMKTIKRSYSNDTRKEDDKDILINTFSKLPYKKQKEILNNLLDEFFSFTTCENIPEYDDYVNPMFYSTLGDFLGVLNGGDEWDINNITKKFSDISDAFKEILKCIKYFKKEYGDRFNDEYLYNVINIYLL